MVIHRIEPLAAELRVPGFFDDDWCMVSRLSFLANP
jgi:hypothetical protein